MNLHGLLLYAQHHSIAVSLVLVAAVVVWQFNRNEDLREHRITLLVSVALLGTVPFIGWLTTVLTRSKPAGVGMAVIAGAVLVRLVVRVLDRATNDFLGGFVFDFIFSEGAFSERARAPRKLPNLTLLRHWRGNGGVRRAYRAARRGMCRTQDAYPVWLFAVETAAQHLDRLPTAVQIVRRLCRARVFTEDQKVFALNQLKGWAATRGYDLDISRLHKNGGSARPRPLSEIAKLRHAGRCEQARAQLVALLQREPENLAAAVLLVRVYAQDLQQPEKAEQAICKIDNQPTTPQAVTEFLRRSLPDWAAASRRPHSTPPRRPAPLQKSNPPPSNRARIVLADPPTIRMLQPPAPVPSEPAEVQPGKNVRPAYVEGLSPRIALLVSDNRLGTAVEELEGLIRQRPDEFGLIVELAQVHFMNCESPKIAERLMTRIELNPRFTVTEKEAAIAKLATWRKKLAELQPFRSYS